MMSYWQQTCAVCGREEGLWHTLAIDHWIPLASPECPGTIASNMLPLCHGIDGCNNSKKHSPPEVWLLQRFGKHKAKQIIAKIASYFAVVQERFGTPTPSGEAAD